MKVVVTMFGVVVGFEYWMCLLIANNLEMSNSLFSFFVFCFFVFLFFPS